MEKVIKIVERDYLLASDDDYLGAMGREFEPYMVQLFRALISPEDVVADIGANIGLTAIAFASLANTVVAFEPSPSTYKILSDNLARANVHNVVPINIGFGHEAGSKAITYDIHNRSGGFVNDKIRLESGYVTEQINIDTLDHYFHLNPVTPTFLKIDVEGFEQSVISGGRDFLQKNRPTVVMEMNHFCLNIFQRITIPEFLDFMRSIFPLLYAVDSDNSRIVDLHDPDNTYGVMYEHVLNHRFPNLVGAYDPDVIYKLRGVVERTDAPAYRKNFRTPTLSKPAGSMLADSVPRAVSTAGEFQVPVVIQNGGNETWHGYGTNAVFLCYHWKNPAGVYIIYDGVRTVLKNQIVQPGETVQETINVIAPSRSGKAHLVLTLVQEGVCWFEDRGFAHAESIVRVNPVGADLSAHWRAFAKSLRSKLSGGF